LSGVNRGYTLTPSSGDYSILQTPVRSLPPEKVPDIQLPQIPTPKGDLTASNTNPAVGDLGVYVLPTWSSGMMATLGTFKGGSDLSQYLLNGVPFQVQPAGFLVATTYWMRIFNSVGEYLDRYITITPVAAS
jgi:hypothetical protein